MRIRDLLSLAAIQLNSPVVDKNESIEEGLRLMEHNGNLGDPAVYRLAVLERETASTTGLGKGIAIPHAKSRAVIRPGLSAQVIPNGVDFASLDGRPVYIIFLIAVPDTREDIHLDILARLSALLLEADFRASLIAASSPEEFLRLVDNADTARMAQKASRITVPPRI